MKHEELLSDLRHAPGDAPVYFEDADGLQPIDTVELRTVPGKGTAVIMANDNGPEEPAPSHEPGA